MAPDVGSAEFQGIIDKAWKEVSEGKSPSRVCSGLKGGVHSRVQYQDPDGLVEKATRAIQVCEYEIPLRYFEAYMDQVTGGTKTCTDFMRHFETEMTAVGIRLGSIEKVKPRGTKDLVLKPLAERIRKNCPEIAPWMLPRTN